MGNLNNVNFSKIVEHGKTTSNLIAGGTFSSNSFSTDNFENVLVSVFSDVDGKVNIQFSWDKLNWDAEAEYSYGAGSALGISLNKIAPYCRVLYENGTTAQSSFRMNWGMKK